MGFDPAKLEQAKQGFNPSRLDQARKERTVGGPVAEQPNLPIPDIRDTVGTAKFLGQTVLPTAGMLAGGLGGAIIRGATGLVSRLPIYAMEGLGAAGGEALNQQAGITEPSTPSVMLNAVAPGIGRLAPAAIQHAPRLLPGSSAAISQAAAEEARTLPGLIQAPDASLLYNQLKQAGNPPIAFPKTQAELTRLKQSKQSVMPGFQDDALLTKLGDAEKHLQGRGGSLDFNEFQQTMESLGKKIGSTADAEQKGVYKSIYKSMLDDVEAMPTPPGTPVNLWKEAKAAYRKQAAKSDLADIIENRGIRTVSEGVESFDANKILDWVRKDKFFQKSVDPKELSQIRDTLQRLTKTPSVRQKPGEASIGSGRRIGAAAVGAAAGEALMPGGMGAALGAAGGLKVNDLIAESLMSPKGRRIFLKWVTANNGRVGQDQAAALSEMLTAGSHD